MNRGILVLDNSALRELAADDVRNQVRRSLRAAGLQPLISEVNVLEALKAPAGIRERLLRLLDTLGDNHVLLPWPFQLLQRSGRAVLEGKPEFNLGETGNEYLLRDFKAAADHEAVGREFMATVDRNFSKMHDGARPKIQRVLRERGWRDFWPSVREFLDEYWYESGMREWMAQLMWKGLGLPGDAPLPQLLQADTWRLALDVEGFAMFERAIITEQSPRVHRPDLIELVYLGLASPRLIVAADNAFIAGAKRILHHRHAGARALHVEEVLELAEVNQIRTADADRAGAASKQDMPAASRRLLDADNSLAGPR